MSRWSYFAKRALLSIPVLFLVMTILFLLLRLGPLDPVAARLGENPQGADIEQMRENLGLNDPLWEQYLNYMGDLLTFSGESWVVRAGQPVGETIVALAPQTLWLGFWAILLPLFIGIPLAFYAGLHPNTKGDYTASISGILWQSMPNFWLAVMALALLRQTQGGRGFLGIDWYTLGPTISSVTGTPDLAFFGSVDVLGLSIPMITNWSAFLADFKLILPAALILGSASMAAELRIGRTAFLETVNSKYVETARAKGLTGRVIVWKHIFRNALIPLVPVITSEAFILIGGSVIVETIFNINGLGRLYYRAIVQADLPLVGALVFMFALIIISLNIFQDLLYTIIDPRVGYER